MAFNAGSVLVTLGLESQKLSDGLSKAQSGLKEFEKQAASIGSTLSLGLTAPILGTGAAAIKASTDLNEAMANVATLMPKQLHIVEEMKGRIQALAEETGKNAIDLADGLYQTISAFPQVAGDTEKAMAMLTVAAKAGVAGLAGTGESLSMLSSVIKGYNLDISEAQKVSDFAFQTVVLGETSFRDLANSMGAVVPMAATLRVTQEDLWGAMATLTGVTGNTSEVTTQLRGVFKALVDPSKEMAGALAQVGQGLIAAGKLDAGNAMVANLMGAQVRLHELQAQYAELASTAGDQVTPEMKDMGKAIESQGKNVQDAAAALGGAIIQSVGLQETLGLLRETTAGNDVVFANMLGRVEALNAALAMTGSVSEDLTWKTEAMASVAGSTEAAYEEQAKGINAFGFELKQLKQSLAVTFQELGDAVAPMVKEFLESVKPFLDVIRQAIDAFANAPEPVKKFAGELIQLAVEAGPILLAVAGFQKLYGAISALFTGPTGWVVVGVALIIEFAQAWAKAKKEQEEYYVKSVEHAKKTMDEADNLDALIKKYEELSGKPSLSAKEHEELQKTMDAIIKLQPNIAKGYKDAGEAIKANIDPLKQYVDKLRQASAAELSKAALKAQTDLPKAEAERIKVAADIKELGAKIGPAYAQAAEKAFYIGKFQTLVNEARIAVAQGVKPDEAWARVMNMLKQDQAKMGVKAADIPKSVDDLLRVLDRSGSTKLSNILEQLGAAERDIAKSYGRNADQMVKLEKQLASLDENIAEMTAVLAEWGKVKTTLGYESGAILPGVSGPDQYPALLAPGEAVVPSHAVQGGPAAVLEWFQASGVPGFQRGTVFTREPLRTAEEARRAIEAYWRYWDDPESMEFDFHPDPLLADLMSLEEWQAQWEEPPEEEAYWDYVKWELIRRRGGPDVNPLREFLWYVAHESIGKELSWRTGNWRDILTELRGWLPGFEGGGFVGGSILEQLLRDVHFGREDAWTDIEEGRYPPWYEDVTRKLRLLGSEWQKPAWATWEDWYEYLYGAQERFGEGAVGLPVEDLWLRYAAEDWLAVPRVHEQGFPYPGLHATEQLLAAVGGSDIAGEVRGLLGYYMGTDVVMGAKGVARGRYSGRDALALAALELTALYEHGFQPGPIDREEELEPWIAGLTVSPYAAVYGEGADWTTVVHENVHKWQNTLADWASAVAPWKPRAFGPYDAYGYQENPWEVEARLAAEGAQAIVEYARQLIEAGGADALRATLSGIDPEIIRAYREVMPWLGLASGGIADGDVLPALVAPGEAIVPSGAVAGGWPAVAAWFKGQGVPGFAEGGVVAGDATRDTGVWARVERAFVSAADGAKRMFGDLGEKMKARLPILSDVMQAAKQGAAVSPEAGAVAAIAALIGHSATFAALAERLNPMLQASADAFGALLEPLLPVATVMSAALTPALMVLSTILSSVALPVMQALFPVFKGFGLVVIGVARVLGEAWNAVARAINAALGWLGINLKLIDTEGLAESFNALNNLTWEQAMAMQEVNRALGNVPQLLKVVTIRMEAAEAAAGGAGARGVGTSGAPSPAGTTVIIQGDVYGWDDFKRRVQQASAEAGRPLALARYGVTSAT